MCTLGINCLNIYSGATSVFSYLPSLSLSLSIFLFFFKSNTQFQLAFHSLEESERKCIYRSHFKVSLEDFFLIKGIVCGGRFCK